MSNNEAYQMCQQCIMDNTFSEVTFDRNGVCNFCRDFAVTQKKYYALPEEKARFRLDSIIAEIKDSGKGKDYDCILGMSGGVDSSYLAVKLKEFNLRPLAVQFDNGWNTELAVHNIETLCTNLHIDLYTYVVDWVEFRDLQLSFLKASVRNVEAPTDHGIFAALYKVADQKNIKYIINGNNFATEGISLPKSFGHAYRDLRHIKGIHRQFGTVPLMTFPQLSLLKRPYYSKIRKIKSVRLLDYFPILYNKFEAIQLLKRENGWRPYSGKHHESIFTRFHQCYILIKKFMVAKRKAHLSNLIYSGQMTREEALAELASPPCPQDILEQDRQFVIKKLGLTDIEFDEIMDRPEKNYREYPNDDRIMETRLSVSQFLSRIRLKG